MKGGFKNWFASFVEGSIILRGISKFAGYIYSKLNSGLYSFVFGSYDTMSETFDESVIGGERYRKRGRLSNSITKAIEESMYINAVASAMNYLSRLSMRVIGAFFMSAGIYTAIAQVVMYLVSESKISLLYGIIAAVMILLGIPMMFSGKAFRNVMYTSLVFGGFVRGICGFNERNLNLDAKPTGRINAAIVIGLPFGILSCVINPAYMLLLIGVIGFAYVILINPECGYNLALFALPFLIVLPHPSIILALLIVITFISFCIKLILGKRYFKIDLFDVIVACFILVLFFGGTVSYGGMQSLSVAMIFIALVLGYFLTVGLANNKESLKKSVSILVVSMLLVSAYGVFQYHTGMISAEWIDTSMFSSIDGRVVSTFENPNMLGEYLILLLPMTLAAFLGENGWFKRIGYVISFVAGCLCLVYTWARGAWLGFIFATVVFLLIWNRKAMGFIIAAIVALPFSVPFLPQSIVERFSSIGNLGDTSTNYRVYIWRGSVNMASDYALTGIGIGEKAFDRIYPYYSFAGIEKAPHAHNLFLQLFIEVGILGFMVFVALLICMLQNGFSLAKHGEDKTVRLIGCGAMCGVFAALVQGMTDYIWYNYRVFFIFWIAVGIVSAARRIDYSLRKNKLETNSENSVDITI